MAAAAAGSGAQSRVARLPPSSPVLFPLAPCESEVVEAQTVHVLLVAASDVTAQHSGVEVWPLPWAGEGMWWMPL